jgi:DNA-binding response OmpR family regulator
MVANELKALRVLIVDDEALIQRLVYNVLTKLGFRSITVANSGRQAINLVSKQSFDFIITDWRMEDMDGIELIRFIRTSSGVDSRVPIILLTGNTEARDVIEARDAGVTEYIIKPFSAEHLVRRIRAVIERPRGFVEATTYRGPDRRHTPLPPPSGQDRRKPRPK